MTVELSDIEVEVSVELSDIEVEVNVESINKNNRSCYRRLGFVIVFLIWTTLVVVIPEIIIGVCIDGYDKVGIMIGFLLLGLTIALLSTVITIIIIDKYRN